MPLQLLQVKEVTVFKAISPAPAIIMRVVAAVLPVQHQPPPVAQVDLAAAGAEDRVGRQAVRVVQAAQPMAARAAAGRAVDLRRQQTQAVAVVVAYAVAVIWAAVAALA
jgi:hypothetical protein